MVAQELRRDLAEEIRDISKEMTFIDCNRKAVDLNVYEQNLPMRKVVTVTDEVEDNKYYSEDYSEEYEEADDEMNDDRFPYVIVRLDSGSSSDADSEHIVRIRLIAGIWDDDLKANGSDTILSLFEKIRQRYRKDPILNSKYRAADKISWAFPDDDDDTFPYFFGAMEIDWITAEIRREDPLA